MVKSDPEKDRKLLSALVANPRAFVASARLLFQSIVGDAFDMGAKAFNAFLKDSTEEELDLFMGGYPCVIAVWLDPGAPGGYSQLSVKGIGESKSFRAIPCIDRQTALRLQARYGDTHDAELNPPDPKAN
jgi:hypothetical protein